MRRRRFLLVLLALGAVRAARGEAHEATLYKHPRCRCCESYARYIRAGGFAVEVIPTYDMDGIRSKHRIPEKLRACHTTLVDGYVVEGHVPVSIIERLLRERPRIRGVSLPGMPRGSPGMTGRKKEPFQIYEIGSDSSEPRVYAVE
jgi:hypothetical protein